MKRITQLLFLFLLTMSVHGQQFLSPNKKADGFYQEARVLFRAGELSKSRGILEKAAKIDSSFSALYLLRADLCNSEGDRKGEIRNIERALTIDSLKGYAYYYTVLADDCFDRGDYETARKFYRLYLQRDKRLTIADRVGKRLENCQFALNALRTGVRQPIELCLQTEHDVYWPSFDVYGETMLFTEQQGDREKMWMLRDSNHYPLDFQVEGKCGAPSLTADGRMMYFTIVTTGRGGSDLFVAYRLSDITWSEPINLGAPINTDGWEAQPAISADGTRLFFASTREGGRGGSDIWFSRLLGRETNGVQHWSQPRCLYFNTPGNEMAPFLYFDNKTLFFSSDGYPGMGRKDVYKVDLDEVSSPQNMGITVNTQGDELGFMVDVSGEWGYFSSDISGKRSIYRYRLEDSLACMPTAYVRLVTQGEKDEPLKPDCLIVTEVVSGDTLAYYDRIYSHDRMLACVPSEKLLLLGAMKKGFLYCSDTMKVKGGVSAPQEKILVLREIRKERTLVLKGIFFDVDDYHLKAESDQELKRILEFMQMNPEIHIEISGHTDNSGSDEHNRQLSENRAFEVYKYLFLHRIGKERMEYKGYGKDRPLTSNDTEEGRAKNRRTEIRIK